MLKRPGIVTLLAVLHFIAAPFMFLIALAVAVAGSSPSSGQNVTFIVAAIFGALGLAQLACGIGLSTLKPYGRTLQLVFASIGLIGVPLGTIISILILVYMQKPGIKALFSGKPVAELTSDEMAQIAAASESSAVVVALVAVLALFGGVALLGIVAAIAIPGLLRACMAANEATAMGTIRALQSAEVAYAASNGGLYDTPDCLVAPANCLPSPASSPFLDATYTSKEARTGYAFQFHPGPSADPEAIRSRGLSPTSLAGFAYVATPASPGVTGNRTFCGDASGLVCRLRDDVTTDLGGACPSTCEPIR